MSCRDPSAVGVRPANESCSELASFVRFTEREYLSGDDEISLDDPNVPSSSDFSAFSSTVDVPRNAGSEEADDIGGDLVESRRHCPLTVQLADAVSWRSRQRKRRGKTRNAGSGRASSEDDPATSRTSSLGGVRRRGKGAAIYVGEVDSEAAAGVAVTGGNDVADFFVVEGPPLKGSTANGTASLGGVRRRGKGAAIYVDEVDSEARRVAETNGSGAAEFGDDVEDFEVVEGPPSLRSNWLDADLAATDRRAFSCRLSRSGLGGLRQRLGGGGGRLIEGGSMPRRWLVDLTDLDDEEEPVLVAADDDRIQSTHNSGGGHVVPSRRLFLIVEQLAPTTSASDHVTCRLVAAIKYTLSTTTIDVEYFG